MLFPIGHDRRRLALTNAREFIGKCVCIGRIDVLVQYLKVDLFTLEFISDLAQMQGGAGQSVQACDNECIAIPDVLQAGLQPGPLVG